MPAQDQGTEPTLWTYQGSPSAIVVSYSPEQPLNVIAAQAEPLKTEVATTQPSHVMTEVAPPNTESMPATNAIVSASETGAHSSIAEPAHEPWTLCIGSFRVKSAAVDEAIKLSAQGHAADIRLTNIKGQNWYRVTTGNFANRDAAKLFSGQLIPLGYQSAWPLQK